MSNLKRVSPANAIAFVTPGFSARAADYSPEPPVMELPPIGKFGGRYLRGDLSIDRVGDFYAGDSFTSAEIDQGFNLGIGVGYQINRHFRYVELGSFNGLTPYVGAGASYVFWSSYRSLNTCTRPSVVSDACCTVGDAFYVAPGAGVTTSVSGVSYTGDQSWLSSYALMAGVSYEFTENLKLDVGYKYTNMGDGTLISDIGGGAFVDHGDIGIHAVQVGLALPDVVAHGKNIEPQSRIVR